MSLSTFTSYDYREDNKKSKEESPVQQFLRHTSITAVTNVKRSKGKLTKLVWLIVSVISCAAMVIQSHNVYVEFSQCKFKEDKVYQAQEFAPFPSITVCDAKPLNWTHMEAINHSLVTKFNSYADYETEKKTELIVMYLLGISDEEREELYNKTEPFLPIASFHDYSEIPPSIRFRHPFFGQCVTTNSGLGPKQSAIDVLQLCSIYAMNIKLPINREGRIPGIHGFSMGYILVHPRGTPPIFTRTETINVYPYNKFTIKVTQEFVQIKSDRKCLSCLQHEARTRENSIYYKKGKFEYIYTMQGCIETATQKYLLEQYNCLDPYSNLDKIRPNQIKNTTTLCTGNEHVKINGACEFGCSEFFTDARVSKWSKLFDSVLIENISEYQNMKLVQTSWSNEVPHEYENTIDAVLRISQQKGYLTVTKLPMYSIGDMLGIVGGNVSLWLGISIFSLWEIIELVFMLVVRKIRMRAANVAKMKLTVSPWRDRDSNRNPSNIRVDHILNPSVSRGTKKPTVIHIY